MALVQLKLDERIDGLIDICGNSLRSRTTAATILYTSEFYDYLGGNFRQLQGLAMVGEAALLWALMKQNHARGFSSGKISPLPFSNPLP